MAMSVLSRTGPSGLRAHVVKRSAPVRLGRNLRLDVAAFTVESYTLRRGDTLESIAEEKGLEVQLLEKLNHSIDRSEMVEGKTIVVPAVALSDMDKGIIQEIDRRYRAYPMRAGESIEAITSKRGTTAAEIEKLKPDVGTKKLKTNQVLKLPASKYTVREREMLMGVARVPTEFFQSKGFTVSACVLVVVGVAGVITWWKERTDGD